MHHDPGSNPPTQGRGRIQRNIKPTREVEDTADMPGVSSASEIRSDQWAVDIVLDRLKSWRRCGCGFAARCPAHADWNPSLSILETETGQVLLKCHAGCSVESILDATGLKFANLFTSEFARRFGQRRDGRSAPGFSGLRPAVEKEIDHEIFAKIIHQCRVKKDDEEDLLPLCRATGLSVRTCLDFSVGFNGWAYTFPEYNNSLQPVGVVYRKVNGQKSCENGSTRSLTIPAHNRPFKGTLYVAEGATDAMALHSWRVRAIGRPGAVMSAQAHDWLKKYLIENGTDGVVIVGDNDTKNEKGRYLGRDAAKGLAHRLATELPETTPISWALPRKGYKDVREQVSAGDWEMGLRVWEVRS